MSQWTKKLLKRRGYYWFWYDNGLDISWPEIIHVFETTIGRFVMRPIYGGFDSECVLEPVILQKKYHRYHFGPAIKEPSCRNLRKSIKQKAGV
jgi:hypothetical protein